MTKDRFVENLEKAFLAEKKKSERDGDASEMLIQYLNTIEAYINMLKICDKEYAFVKFASMAFVGMLNRRILLKNELLGNNIIEVENPSKEDVINSIETVREGFDLVKLQMMNILIFLNIDELRELEKEAKAKLKNKIQSEGEAAVKKQIQEMLEENEKAWIDDFSCTVECIEYLESLIGEHPDFDEVMGRIIRLEKY